MVRLMLTKKYRWFPFEDTVVRVLYGCLMTSWIGCQTSPPHLHSRADREAYRHLSAEDREAIDAGRLKLGMTPEMVVFAWGRPNQRRQSLETGKARVEWCYWGTRWVDQPTWEYVFSSRFGGHWLDFRMRRVGVPFVRARAVFESGRLVAWQPIASRSRLESAR